MGKLHLSIFSFDSRIDFQNGYVREELQYNARTTLKDVLADVNPKNFGYQEFGVNLDFLYCRVNGFAIFGNAFISDLVEQFGNVWTIDPLNKKYSKKDLLLRFEYEFARYQDFFQNMSFIAPSEKEELKKYLPLNFVATCHDNEYYGDGFFLYVKWLIMHHPLQKHKLLEYITEKNSGIFKHVSTANFLFPISHAIDSQIESLQSMLVAFDSSQMQLREFGAQIGRQYGFTCRNKIIGYSNEISESSPLIQDILHANIVK